MQSHPEKGDSWVETPDGRWHLQSTRHAQLTGIPTDSVRCSGLKNGETEAQGGLFNLFQFMLVRKETENGASQLPVCRLIPGMISSGGAKERAIPTSPCQPPHCHHGPPCWVACPQAGTLAVLIYGGKGPVSREPSEREKNDNRETKCVLHRIKHWRGWRRRTWVSMNGMWHQKYEPARGPCEVWAVGGCDSQVLSFPKEQGEL